MSGATTAPASSTVSINPLVEMVSRRKILSRSRDDLTSSAAPELVIEEEDVWYTKDKLVKVRLI